MCGANIPLAAGIWSSVFFIASGSLGVTGDVDPVQLGRPAAPPHLHLLPLGEQQLLLSIKLTLAGN